jgi:hypothetical protein
MNERNHSSTAFVTGSAVVLGVVLVGRWKRTCRATFMP